ncbi:glycosyl hydrolase family 32 [Cellulomonas sp. ATA003]|uniref:glycosyl hydrolase family 32 n=1 Tax=Cellulomonas sp. ATA003 TaxID=3073064 RepID=UPI002872EE91|nr:glycosyl hydrolase family 32 [Cellulomonas sp. ATA003]WNB87321.1 glycosyl hydrolase family 32 [Cellulomonas sp. ATA003]
MHSVYYQHPDTWFGDCMPFFHDGTFYLFHQRDTRRPGPFGEPFGWALATTTDFVTYTDHGDAIVRGGDDEQDQFIFAGSVFAAHGRFYAAYTGYNRDFAAQGRPAQVLMMAVSDDLLTWHKTGTGLVAPEPGYDPENWRDPFVLRDEENDRWVMILGARRAGDRVLTGSTVWYTSPDLDTWDFHGDFWAPGLYSMHEMPDLFHEGGLWYLLTTEYSDRSKTVYRSSPSLTGPWSAPVDDAFDGRAYYAARSVSDGEHRYLVGWVATKTGESDERAPFEWGGALVVHEVVPRPDGSLATTVPSSVWDSFSTRKDLVDSSIKLASEDGRAETHLDVAPGDPFALELAIRWDQPPRSIGIRLREDADTGDGYEFRLMLGERRLVFDRRPNYPWFVYDNRGLERPLDAAAGVDHTIQVIVDDTIMTCYIDGVALNARAYHRPGEHVFLDVVDGSVEVLGVTRLTR